MLETVIYNQGEYTFPSLLVLGCFDAIHMGHRELLKKAKLQAKINGLDLGVMLFRDGKGGDTVFTLDERLELLQSYNVKFVILVDYNDEFRATTAADFLKVLDNQLNLKAVMSGKDFRFGAGAKGKSSTLKNYADDDENGIWYMSVKDVAVNGEKVSTTQIKQLLQEGNVAAANELLCSNFKVTGKVVAGHGRGGEVIGFPTVNITYPEGKVKLKQGVYKVKSAIGGTEYQGIANYGARPTFGEDDCVLEVNYEGLNKSLYGEEITVEFIDYIRDIVAFSSAEELADQLARDKTLIEDEPAEDKPQDEPAEEVAHSEEEPAQEEVTKEETAEEPQPEAFEETTEEPQTETTEEITEEIQEETAEEEVEEQPIEERSEPEEQSDEEVQTEPEEQSEETPDEQPIEEQSEPEENSNEQPDEQPDENPEEAAEEYKENND